MSEREQFEAWGGDQGYPLRRIHDEADQQYLDLRTQGAWEAWQAARAQPAQAGQVLTDEEIDAVYIACRIGGVQDFARAIEQAVLAKRVPMTDEQINDAYGEARV